MTYVPYNLHYEKFADGTVKCIEDEIPFEVPEGWAWTRTNCVIDVRDGTHDTPAYVENGVPLITSKNLTPAGVDYTNVKYISRDDAIQISQRSGVDVGDILFAMIGTIGNPTLVIEDTLISIKNVALFKFSYSCDMNHLYILRLFENLQEEMKANPSGGLQPFVSLNKLRMTLMPIAPIKEQTRIVENLNVILNSIDTINDECDKLNGLINSVKSKILNLAIRGKIVPQDPNDEPASVLLERIRAEKEELIKQGKIKRDKKESVIFKGEDNSYYEKIGDKTICIDNEIPFALPDNWHWCRLGLISSVYGRIGFRGYTKDDLVPKGNGAITLSPSNIVDNKMCYKNLSYISWHKYDESPEIQIKNGNILLVKTGSSYGKAAIVQDLPQKATINPQFVVLKNILIITDYLCLILQSAYAKETFDAFAVGTAIPTFTQANLNSMLLPIPPVNEQKAICHLVTKIFNSFKEIEQSFN